MLKSTQKSFPPGLEEPRPSTPLQGALARLSTALHSLEDRDDEIFEIRQVIFSAIEGIARFSPDGHYVNINPAYAASLGYTPEEMVGMHWSATVPQGDLAAAAAARKQIEATATARLLLHGLRKDGEVFNKDVVLVAIRTRSGVYSGCWSFMRRLPDHVILDPHGEIKALLRAIDEAAR